jgi:Cu-processing system permease protein
VQLVLLLVPLMALLSGVMAFTPDTGAAELLYSQPISRNAVLFGQCAGLLLSLVASQAIGLGAAGIVLMARTGSDGLASFVGVFAGAVVLSAVFLSLSAALTAGATSGRRASALAFAIAVWFAAVVVFDVAALGAASLLPSGLGSRVLMVSAIVNPVDAVRTATLLGVDGTSAFGAASAAFLRFVGGPAGAATWLAISIGSWVALPMLLAARRLGRADF